QRVASSNLAGCTILYSRISNHINYFGEFRDAFGFLLPVFNTPTNVGPDARKNLVNSGVL
ncbi:MAG: hypothetical protein WBD16_12270, partial [Pyrinomonadaceae bacterium]